MLLTRFLTFCLEPEIFDVKDANHNTKKNFCGEQASTLQRRFEELRASITSEIHELSKKINHSLKRPEVNGVCF